MRKKWIAFLLVSLMLLSCSATVFARDNRIVDEADLLTGSEEAELSEKAAALADTYQIDVVILTIDSLDGAYVESYADDYYDSHDYGYGSDYSGVLFLLAMDTRDWAISTTGDGIYALTDYGIESLFEKVAPYLADDDYYSAFDRYLDELEWYFDAYAQGEAIDGYTYDYHGPGTYEPGTREDVVYSEKPLTAGKILFRLAVSLILGAVAGGVVLLILRRGMNTARAAKGADSYMAGGSFRLTHRQNILLQSHVSRTSRSENNGSGGHRGGGGSSIHTGSSGRSHGGGHGKF